MCVVFFILYSSIALRELNNSTVVSALIVCVFSLSLCTFRSTQTARLFTLCWFSTTFHSFHNHFSVSFTLTLSLFLSASQSNTYTYTTQMKSSCCLCLFSCALSPRYVSVCVDSIETDTLKIVVIHSHACVRVNI